MSRMRKKSLFARKAKRELFGAQYFEKKKWAQFCKFLAAEKRFLAGVPEDEHKKESTRSLVRVKGMAKKLAGTRL